MKEVDQGPRCMRCEDVFGFAVQRQATVTVKATEKGESRVVGGRTMRLWSVLQDRVYKWSCERDPRRMLNLRSSAAPKRTVRYGRDGVLYCSLGEHRVRRECRSTVPKENKSGCHWADVAGGVSRSRVVSKGRQGFRDRRSRQAEPAKKSRRIEKISLSMRRDLQGVVVAIEVKGATRCGVFPSEGVGRAEVPIGVVRIQLTNENLALATDRRASMPQVPNTKSRMAGRKRRRRKDRSDESTPSTLEVLLQSQSQGGMGWKMRLLEYYSSPWRRVFVTRRYIKLLARGH